LWDFLTKKSSEEFKIFEEVAGKLKEDFLFAVAVGIKDAKTQFNIITPSVIVFKTFDEGKVILEGSKFSQLEEWAYVHRFPLLDDITKENAKEYITSAIPIGFFFVETQEHRDTYGHIIRELAKETRNKLNFVYIDWTKYGDQAKKLALSGTKVPALAIEDTKQQLHYAFDESKDLTLENLRSWVNQFLAGELEPTLISEALPEKNDGPVKIVVGRNFKQIVLDDSKDVFIELYAPWCGHCKALAPTWEELGKAFQQGDSSVVIAKMDATANFYDKDTKVNMYPTLKLYKAGDKKNPIIFDGKDKDLESLIAFVKANKSTMDKKTSKDEL